MWRNPKSTWAGKPAWAVGSANRLLVAGCLEHKQIGRGHVQSIGGHGQVLWIMGDCRQVSRVVDDCYKAQAG